MCFPSLPLFSCWSVASTHLSLLRRLQVFKDMVAHGATLARTNTNPEDNVLPLDIVEAHKYNQFEADAI